MSEFEERYAELRARFLESLPERLAQIRAALHAHDLVMARRHVHNLKGTAASLEAHDLATRMKAMEARLDAALAGEALTEEEWARLESECQ